MIESKSIEPVKGGKAVLPTRFTSKGVTSLETITLTPFEEKKIFLTNTESYDEIGDSFNSQLVEKKEKLEGIRILVES